VWKLFPRGQSHQPQFLDHNDVAPAYFAAAEIAARDPKVGIITLEVARPDFPVADRGRFADSDLKAAAKGFYVIRDFAPGAPRHGYVVAQGSSSTVNLLKELPRLEQAGITSRWWPPSAKSCSTGNRKRIAVRSCRRRRTTTHGGFDRHAPRVAAARSGSADRRLFADLGLDNQWLTGGLEPEVIAEAHLDPQSIFAGVERFARERELRIGSQRELLSGS